jgi:hypothetical protein
LQKINFKKLAARISGVSLAMVAVFFVFAFKGAIGDVQAPAELVKK